MEVAVEGSHVCAEKAKKKNDYRSESMTSDRHVMGVGVREDEVFGLVEAARKEDKKKKSPLMTTNGGRKVFCERCGVIW